MPAAPAGNIATIRQLLLARLRVRRLRPRVVIDDEGKRGEELEGAKLFVRGTGIGGVGAAFFFKAAPDP